MNTTETRSTWMNLGVIPQTILVLVLTIVTPMVIHLIPLSGPVPAGARVLPMFYAPLAGVLLLGWRVGFLAGVLAPVVNHLITGMPVWELVWLLSLELGIFTSWVWLLAKNRALIWVSGPLAYVLTKCISAPMIGLFQDTTPWTFWAGSIVNALPGLVILTVLTLLFVRYDQSHT